MLTRKATQQRSVPDAMRSDKYQWRKLADGLLAGDAHATEACVRFFEGETRDIGHGRVRALIARRLKHCALDEDQRARVTAAVWRRLVSGTFAEQFRDQLRTALFFDRQRTREIAAQCLESPRPHVRRLAQWVLEP